MDKTSATAATMLPAIRRVHWIVIGHPPFLHDATRHREMILTPDRQTSRLPLCGGSGFLTASPAVEAMPARSLTSPDSEADEPKDERHNRDDPENMERKACAGEDQHEQKGEK